MTTTIESKGNEFLLTFTSPESEWIREVADSMGITREAVVGAAMNKGLTYYVETFCSREVIDDVLDYAQDELGTKQGLIIHRTSSEDEKKHGRPAGLWCGQEVLPHTEAQTHKDEEVTCQGCLDRMQFMS